MPPELEQWRKSVYIVTVNWNNVKATSQCLASLRECSYQPLEIIVVDNASLDNSGEQLQAMYPQVRLIRNDKNLGFARACNVGMRTALYDQKCGYVVLVNNDSVVTPDFLKRAVATAEENRKIGLVGGKVLQSPVSKKIWYAGGYVDRLRGQAVTRGYGEIDCGQYDKPCEVGFVTAALMLVTREVLEKVGLLPEDYFFGVEEWDYSLTVKRAGYKLYYVPEFLVYHEGDGSHWNYDPKYVYNYYRNKLIFQEKFLPKGTFPLWKIALSLYGKYFARRTRERLIRKYEYDKNRKVAFDDLDFALRKAIEDHRTNVLSEETLYSFDHELKIIKSDKGGDSA